MLLKILLYYHRSDPLDFIWFWLGIGLIVAVFWASVFIIGGTVRLVKWFKENPVAIVLLLAALVLVIYLAAKEEPKVNYVPYTPYNPYGK